MGDYWSANETSGDHLRALWRALASTRMCHATPEQRVFLARYRGLPRASRYDVSEHLCEIRCAISPTGGRFQPGGCEMKLSDGIEEYVVRKHARGHIFEKGQANLMAFSRQIGDVDLSQVRTHQIPYIFERRGHRGHYLAPEISGTSPLF